MNWAWEQELPPPAKLILMALADAANEEGRCWPRIKTLATKCCVSGRTVQRVLREFETSGLVTVTRRFAPGRGQTSNSYLLGAGSPPDKLTPPAQHRRRGDTGDAAPATQHRQRGGDSDESYQEPKQNPQPEPPQRKEGSGSVLDDLRFPRSLSSAELDELRALLLGIPGADAQVLLDELIGALADSRTIRTSPMRWFRAIVRRYRAGLFAPNIALDVARGRRRQDDRPNRQGIAAHSRASEEAVQKHMADIAKIIGVS